MKILVLGGDGFCGWPVSLALSKEHDVVIFDSLVRRSIDEELGTNSLTPIKTIHQRIKGTNIEFRLGSLCSPEELEMDIHSCKPDVIIHFAEQRSAPYSMLSSRLRSYTVHNNIIGTNNLLNAIVDFKPNIHLIHLGTMGVYGYSTSAAPLPEGYVDAIINGETRNILYPSSPGSVYHMTKVMDHTMFQFYAKNYNLKITDLHQGIIWGTQTDETLGNEDWINRFDYDGEFGTVLNRFIVQAASNHPLTVYGTGEQTRAFIHIKDCIKCIKLAIANPPDVGEKVRVLNQLTETHSVKSLATMISKLHGVPISYEKNPRKENESNSLAAASSFTKLGLTPTFLEEGVLTEIFDIAKKYASRIIPKCIPSNARW